jgi:hypothetical protein
LVLRAALLIPPLKGGRLCEQGGRLRDFTMVHAVPGLSELVELNTIGVFVFFDTVEECRLWCVYRADGPKVVDFDALSLTLANLGGALESAFCRVNRYGREFHYCLGLAVTEKKLTRPIFCASNHH